MSTKINIRPLSRRTEGKTPTDFGPLYGLQTLRRVTPIGPSLQDISVILPNVSNLYIVLVTQGRFSLSVVSFGSLDGALWEEEMDRTVNNLRS